jgi:hypothetical protein
MLLGNWRVGCLSAETFTIMEITKFQQSFNLTELEQGEYIGFFDYYKREQKRLYDAQRYQKNRKQLKRYYQISKKCQALGISKPKLVNGIIAGEPKTSLTRKERNRNHYLNKKRHQKQLNNFLDFSDLGNSHPAYQKKIYKRKVNDRKLFDEKLRQSGKTFNDIFNISNLGVFTPYSHLPKKPVGRPRSEEALKLGRPLNNQEWQRRKREKLKATQPTK